MKKKYLIEALEKFNDDDHIIFEDFSSSYVPKMEAVCGKGQKYMAYFCVRKPNHEGQCWCSCKDVNFDPD